jgi:hypothetical protein
MYAKQHTCVDSSAAENNSHAYRGGCTQQALWHVAMRHAAAEAPLQN